MDMRSFINLVEDSELPMDKASRLARAKEMGFTIPAYHGTGNKFNEFSLEKGQPSMLGGYAPMFADKKAEAKGYADSRKEEGLKAHLLHVLLRVRNPLVINIYGRDGFISPEEYERIVGQPYQPGQYTPKPTGYAALRDLEGVIGYDVPARERWTRIYHKLQKLGYDGFAYTQTPGDHHDDYYTKYVVFDPKNIRSINAAFDPAQSESRNIKA